VTNLDPDAYAQRLAAQSLAADDPTGWFEQLYAEAAEGRAVVPWFRGAPRPPLVQWAEERGVTGNGRRALVIGCGLGDDAEYVAGLGFTTVAFDVSASAIRTARRRFPDSAVEYVVADLLHPPAAWHEAFDLVVESYNVQSLPKPVQPEAIVQVGRMVGRGGTLLVIAHRAGEADPGHEPEPGRAPEPGREAKPGHEPGREAQPGRASESSREPKPGHEQDREAQPGHGRGPGGGPPWPLSRAEVASFATGDLRAVRLAEVADGTGSARWVAEFARP
jgi:SAM-dependent methyltransferase